MSRLPVTKTPKCLVGGSFIRSESGRVYPIASPSGEFLCNIPLCTRKDVRNAVEAAAKAGPAWMKRSAYNRGQILYRLAEMLESRSEELAASISTTTGDHPAARREIDAAIDRAVHYAGWTDKFEALLGSVNPVASPHFNFTITEPMGIVGILPPEEAPLLGLLSMVLPAITAGNTVVALASKAHPLPAILLGEIIAVSDLPAGVVNLLTGSRADILETFATHEHIRALHATATRTERTLIHQGASTNLKRTTLLPVESQHDWFNNSAAGLDKIRQFLEFKTVWHPIAS